MTCRVRESRRWKVVGFITCDLRGVKKPGERAPAALFPATYKEMVASMIPSSRLVVAGVIGVTRAQEYGYSVVHAG